MKYVLNIICLLLLSSCMTYDSMYTGSNLYNNDKVNSSHEITFQVMDVNDKPIEGVEIRVTEGSYTESDIDVNNKSLLSEMGNSDVNDSSQEKFQMVNRICGCVTQSTYSTDESGKVTVPLSSVLIDSKYGTHYTIVEYDVSLNNYFSGNTSSTLELYSTPVLADSDLDKTEVKEIVLYSKEDFLSRDFQDDEVKERVIELLDYLYNQGILEGNNLLQPFSIDFAPFRDNNNLSFTFQNFNIYNSGKLTKYEVVSRVFDESIRKQLNPLNDYLSDFESIDGYSISVNTSYKNFVNDEEIPEDLFVTFHFDKNDIREYKNFDITGQELLNRSFIILDNERIELRLQ